MKVTGLDGKEYKFNPSKHSNRKQRSGKSQYHILARSAITETFPNDVIMEEITLPGSSRSALYADFFIQRVSLIVEVHGEQHYEFVPFFHKTKANFLLSKKRDRDKKEWCDINGFKYLALSYKEVEEWKHQIRNAT
jgi:hypothetical protein